MDLVHGDVRKLFFKYLATAFGSTIIVSIYSLIDAAAVGRYHGPDGAGALAAIMPMWTLFFCLGLMLGVGGSVHWCSARGSRPDAPDIANRYFTAAAWGSIALSVVLYAGVLTFDREMLEFFGARGGVLETALKYVGPVELICPLFLISQAISPFVRADGSPWVVMLSVLAGGAINIVGDYALVFAFDMGSRGAGIATACGMLVTFAVMMTHFVRKRCTLRLVRMRAAVWRRCVIDVCATGFSAFFVDCAVGILTVIMNRQIIERMGADELAIYGVLTNVSIFVLCCSYSVGQAASPIISENFGARRGDRVLAALKCSLASAAAFGAVWFALSEAVPMLYVRLFMAPTEAVLAKAPGIIRVYAIGFIVMPLNIYATYHLQSVMRNGAAFAVSAARGLVISGSLMLMLPRALGSSALWYAMPAAELLVSLLSAYLIVGCSSKTLHDER